MKAPPKLPPFPWKNRLALVTGASSGIGEAVARRFARAGLGLLLVARRQARLEALAQELRAEGGQVDYMAADLADEKERQRVLEQAAQRFGRVDILVNNAGFGWYGFGSEMPTQTALEMIELNVSAVVHLTLHCLNQMRQQGSGHIINIGSISGDLPSQGIAVYGATKAFLNNFTTALYRELKGTALKVSVVRAGPVRTPFAHTAVSQPGGRHLPTERMGVRPEQVAEQVWRLVQHPRRVVYIPGWLSIIPWMENSFGWLIDRLGPLLLKHKT